MDVMFGSGSPMWTAFPTMGLPYQPLGLGNRTIPGPTFGTPGTSPGLGSQLSNGLAVNSSASWIVPDIPGVMTPSTLLTAVALRRGQPQGPTNDNEVEEFIYDALDLLPGAADVEVRCENGRVTLSGAVQHKRSKRDVGEIALAPLVLYRAAENDAAVLTTDFHVGGARQQIERVVNELFHFVVVGRSLRLTSP